MRHLTIHPGSALLGAACVALAVLLAGMRPAGSGLTLEQARILGLMSLVQAPDGAGGSNETLVIGGVNVQIVNGLGATGTTNGVGNLIVGYDELGVSTEHTGSHNVVGGTRNRYTSFGGVVVGRDNAIVAPFASITGGEASYASGECSSVCGGAVGYAEGYCATVGGGKANIAYGEWSTVSGGWVCGAYGELATVSGGLFNFADGQLSSICGGQENTAEGDFSVVSGGCELVVDDDCAHAP